jgi:hypothetical protein
MPADCGKRRIVPNEFAEQFRQAYEACQALDRARAGDDRIVRLQLLVAELRKTYPNVSRSDLERLCVEAARNAGVALEL